jgi:hypothetical protein
MTKETAIFSLCAAMVLTPLASQAIMVSQGIAPTNTLENFDSLPSDLYADVVDLGSAAMSGTFAPDSTTATAGPNGDYETYTANPGDPLTLVGQGRFENISVADPGLGGGANGVIGLLANANNQLLFDTVGMVSFLFDRDQSVVGIDLLGIDGPAPGVTLGTFTFSFFDRMGSLIDSPVILSPADTTTKVPDGPYTFTSSSINIAGFTIVNDDQFGVVYDNLRYNVPSASTPGPATPLLLALGLAGLGANLRKPRR